MSPDSLLGQSEQSPTHLLHPLTGDPLTVWCCTCGTLEVGTPESPYPTRPRAHHPSHHAWTPVSQRKADEFVESLSGGGRGQLRVMAALDLLITTGTALAETLSGEWPERGAFLDALADARNAALGAF